MIELPIGTRFYYKGELCEVSECMHCMATCVFNIENYEVCRMFVCEPEKRKDGVGVFFERVKESAKTTASGVQLQRQDLQQVLQL